VNIGKQISYKQIKHQKYNNESSSNDDNYKNNKMKHHKKTVAQIKFLEKQHQGFLG